jgi:hypothetical protein
MNPFDALLVARGELAAALERAIAAGGPDKRPPGAAGDPRRGAAQEWRMWRDRIRDEPETEAVCAFLSRSGGRPHPYDLCLQNLGASLDPLEAHTAVGGLNADSVRSLGRELLDLPTLPQVEQYTSGLGDDEPT